MTSATAFAVVFGVAYGGFMLWFAWQMFVAWPRQERELARKSREGHDEINRMFTARIEESRRLEFPARYPESLRRAWRP